MRLLHATPDPEPGTIAAPGESLANFSPRQQSSPSMSDQTESLLPADPTAPTLGAMIALAAKWQGGAEMFADPDDRLTGDETLEAIARVAGGLAARGIGKGSVVAFLSGSSVRHAVTFFACQWLGGVACSLHARDTAERLGRTAGWLEVDAIVFDDGMADMARRIAGDSGRSPLLVNFGDMPLDPAATCFADLRAAAPIPMADLSPDDPAAILLSSGTTGEPKGVVHLHRTLFAASRVCGPVYGETAPGDAIIVVMAPSFAAWVIICLPMIAARVRVVFDRAFDPAGFLETLARERITQAPLVPTMWRMVLAAGPERYDLSALKSLTFSGEPGTPDLVAALAERMTPDVRTAYLSSEGNTASAIAAGPKTLIAAGKAGSAGKPVPGADLRLVDPEGGIDAVLPAGTPGEILLRSPSLGARYWKDEARTADKFVGGWWRSGDLGRLDADGDLFVVGRTDNVINSGGIKVHAEEVEAALSKHPGVAMVAVIGAPDETWGQRIEAHVVRADPALEEAALLSFCLEEAGLPRMKLPKKVVFVEALPTGPTGKLYRRGLLG